MAEARSGSDNEQAVGAGDDWDGHWIEFSAANERNPAQDYRRMITLFLVSRFGTPDRVLDIGSGSGELLAEAAVRWPAAQLRGLELSPVGVAESQRKVPTAQTRVCDLLRDPVTERGEAAWATHAVCSEVLEHVDEPVTLLRNARAWLAPGCRLVVTVPGGPMSAFDRHIGHRRHFSPADLEEMFRSAGLEVLLTGGAGFPFFNLYRSLVILRGSRLVKDAAEDAQGTPQGAMIRAAMVAFRPLLAVSLPRSPLGWQTVGVAREPHSR
jgi:SAM-dependent methyltransferase